MKLLRVGNQRVGENISFAKSKRFIVLRQQPKTVRGQVLLVVVVAERQVFVLLVVFLVVLVVGVVQCHEVHDANLFTVAGDVVNEMVNKPTKLHHGADALSGGRSCHQHQEGKGYGQEFFHQAQK